MGNIEWHKDSGEILSVHVYPSYRRLGVANTLFHEAHKAAREQGLAEPKHSEDRSEMGDAWAKQAGGEVPTKWKPKEDRE
jgi:ribosomal protein S18 acetylase RimI-like enzyme